MDRCDAVSSSYEIKVSKIIANSIDAISANIKMSRNQPSCTSPHNKALNKDCCSHSSNGQFRLFNSDVIHLLFLRDMDTKCKESKENENHLNRAIKKSAPYRELKMNKHMKSVVKTLVSPDYDFVEQTSE